MIKDRIYASVIFFCLVLGVLQTPAFYPIVYAQGISTDEAVRIIVNEAADQGLKGMICVGEVLRHRGGIKGFHGSHSNGLMGQPKSVWEMAAKAWDLSAHTDYTNGADHFENIRKYGIPWWAKHCVKTYEYKDHVFYKESR
jgi:hypothetical protein